MYSNAIRTVGDSFSATEEGGMKELRPISGGYLDHLIIKPNSAPQLASVQAANGISILKRDCWMLSRIPHASHSNHTDEPRKEQHSHGKPEALSQNHAELLGALAS